PSERDRIIIHLQKNNSFKDEYIEFKTKTGELILALWSAETIVLNGKKLMLSMIHDITERVKAETELKNKMDELEKFNRAMVGRENKMIELKQEINELLEKLGQNKKYRMPGENEENQKI
ncbi:MAG: PAS domain S-box protein, partial [Bacteroidales bacterium]|nr:PAS domain S-box protein [Bacteroidales bacterium]